MRGLDYWHPAMLSRKLTHKPVSIKLCNKDIVLFRAKDGSIGALEDCCLHRRMRLSKGRVEGNCLVCPYHSWRYSQNGEVKSPGTPNLRLYARRFEAIERQGAIWVKSFDSVASFPEIEVVGYRHVCTLHHSFNIPLELVIDNFSEAEHTPTTHAMIGFDLERLCEVEIHVELTEDTVRIVTAGPQRKRPIPRILEWMFRLHRGDWFVDEWVTYFSPIYAVYSHSWINQATGELLERGMRTAVFFNPVDKEKTDLMTFVFAPHGSGTQLNFDFLFKPLIRIAFYYDILQDKRMLENLADKSTALSGMKLGRFDRPLGEIRKRIDCIYWGKQQSMVEDEKVLSS